MENEIQVRLVNEQDAEFLYQLMNCPPVMERLNEVPTTRQDWTDAISEWMKDEDEEDYNVLVGDNRAGWLGINGLRGGDRCAYLKMAAFLPEYQEKGYGTCSIREVMDSLATRNIEQVILYTDSDNLCAQACYRKCGFTVAESMTEIMSNGKTVNRVKMVYSLK